MTQSMQTNLTARDRILVVADGGRLLETVRLRFPDWDVASSSSYLAGISDLARQPARVVLVFVNSGIARLDRAVAGLREAAGAGSRLVLCCPPELEPRTRRLMDAGADDYVVYPVSAQDLDTAFGMAPRGVWPQPGFTPAPAASMTELSQLGELLSHLDEGPSHVLGRLADLLRTAMDCETVCVTVDTVTVPTGVDPNRLVLVEPIEAEGKTLGRIGVGPRAGRPFTKADTLKLRHYATLSGHLVTAASRHRDWRELAMTDEVTGLPNRRYLCRFVTDLIERARREQFRVTMLVFDIDDFKTYNDTFGHDVGDEVLRVTANLFRRHTREHDLVARYGGDEFAVVFWDAEQPRVAGSQHPSDALAVLRRCTDALQKQEFPMLGPNARGVLTVSGGLATFPWHADNAMDLIRRADDALLVAKRAGKDRIYLIGEAEDPRTQSP
jgi:diguanylate cyclase (GGDEF)-like protein